MLLGLLFACVQLNVTPSGKGRRAGSELAKIREGFVPNTGPKKPAGKNCGITLSPACLATYLTWLQAGASSPALFFRQANELTFALRPSDTFKNSSHGFPYGDVSSMSDQNNQLRFKTRWFEFNASGPFAIIVAILIVFFLAILPKLWLASMSW
jgi:hypothetical protein